MIENQLQTVKKIVLEDDKVNMGMKRSSLLAESAVGTNLNLGTDDSGKKKD